MTMDSTEAKIGRSMKKRENTLGPLRFIGPRNDKSVVAALGRVFPKDVHLGVALLGVVAHALEAADDDALAGLDALLDDAQRAVLGAQLHAPVGGVVVVIDDPDELLPLVGGQRLLR